MLGSCSGCPSSGATLKNGILKMMKHYVGEVNDVVAKENEGNWILALIMIYYNSEIYAWYK